MPTDVSHEVNLDISHSDGLRLTDADNTYAPDVLIVPSKLKEFSKVSRPIFRPLLVVFPCDTDGTFDSCNKPVIYQQSEICQASGFKWRDAREG